MRRRRLGRTSLHRVTIKKKKTEPLGPLVARAAQERSLAPKMARSELV
jgi:hypothetical protein